eukprot:6173220-Pleurochrysis_carterae.AAC.1
MNGSRWGCALAPPVDNNLLLVAWQPITALSGMYRERIHFCLHSELLTMDTRARTTEHVITCKDTAMALPSEPNGSLTPGCVRHRRDCVAKRCDRVLRRTSRTRKSLGKLFCASQLELSRFPLMKRLEQTGRRTWG